MEREWELTILALVKREVLEKSIERWLKKGKVFVGTPFPVNNADKHETGKGNNGHPLRGVSRC